jgi:formylglycine-generating enzyme required for sulfatase activity
MSRIFRVGASLAVCATFAIAQTAREKRIAPVDTSQRQSFDKQPKVAVLAGVGHYTQFSGLTQLRYPAHDVDLLEAELTRQGYKVVALKDQEATRGSIEQALRNVSELVDHGTGTVLFFFSGHGFADQGANYLATFEASAADLAGSGMSVRRVEELLKGTGAPRQVMFIDACRNETGSKGSGARSFAALQEAAGLRALLSTKAGHSSYEDDSLGSGVFTHFLVEGLRGQAAGQDGLITFRDLSDFVTDGVSSYGFKKGQMQVPYEAGEASGDFLLARASASGAPARAPTPVPAANIDRGPQPGSTKVNAKDGQRYVWIPPGSFIMGCSPGDNDCQPNEKPPHNVSITKGFWLGQTSVTVAAWKRYVQATGKSMPAEPKIMDKELNPGWREEQQPITMVSWDDAKGYCEWAGGRLPTEAEWEYAARAGSTDMRYANLDDIAWYADNSGNSRIDSMNIFDTDKQNYARRLADNGNHAHSVGLKRPNAWNLYDMLGNVWQWTADWYGEAYYDQQESAGDPRGPANGQYRALRGGSWSVYPRNVRVSGRSRTAPDSRNLNAGVRCAGE